MSPSESQLRAALHDGEGDGLDAGSIVSRATRVRQERRRRIVNAAGGAAVVALVGVGVTALVQSSHSSGGGAAGSVAGGAGQPYANSSPGHGSGASRAAGAATSGVGCPAQPERLMLPGGGGSGQFGSTGKLFPHGATSILVCGYPAVGGPRSVVLNGADAAAVATELDAAPATVGPSGSSGTGCPAAVRTSIELIAGDATGAQLKPVVITINCGIEATNGTAVRYPGTLPAGIAGVVRTIPDRTRDLGTPGRNEASPTH